MIAPPTRAHLLALALTCACTKAEFAPIDGGQAQTGSTTTTSTGTHITCSAPNLACASGSQPGLCDPVCQTGGCDWCSQKCNYAYSGQLACGGFGQKAFPQSCTPSGDGSDDCAPGSICLEPSLGDGTYVCLALCRVSGDCVENVNCGARKLTAAGPTVLVCDPPYYQVGTAGSCDPLANTGCDTARTCLLVAPDTGTDRSRTVCEFSYGDGRDGAACTASRDCMTRFTCVDNVCRQVCDNGHPCPDGKDCMPHGSDYGTCI